MTTFIEEVGKLYKRCDVSNNMIDDPIHQDEFQELILNLVSERIIGENAGSDMNDNELVHAIKKMYEWGIGTGRQLESGKIKQVDEREWEMVASILDQFEQTFTNRSRKQQRTTLYEGTKEDKL